jgi:hypothetical protein
MSLHSQLFGGAVNQIHSAVFSSLVSVSLPGAPTATTPAVVHNARQESRTDNNGNTNQVVLRRCRFTELQDIRIDAVITIDGEQWSIDQKLNTETPGVEVELTRTVRQETSRPGFRGR